MYRLVNAQWKYNFYQVENCTVIECFYDAKLQLPKHPSYITYDRETLIKKYDGIHEYVVDIGYKDYFNIFQC